MRVHAWTHSAQDQPQTRSAIGRASRRVSEMTRRVFEFGRVPLGLFGLLFVVDVGVYLVDVWSGALIAVRQLLFVVAVFAGFTRNFWVVIFFTLLSAFLHVQAFREYVPHPQDFTDVHYLGNFLIALIPYGMAGYLGAVFMAFVAGRGAPPVKQREQERD